MNFPPLTSEEREKVSKQAAKLAEDSKIAIRNSRQEVKSKIASSKKSKEISDDDAKSAESKLQDLTNSYNKKIDSIKEACGVDFNTIQTDEEAIKVAEEHHVEVPEGKETRQTGYNAQLCVYNSLTALRKQPIFKHFAP